MLTVDAEKLLQARINAGLDMVDVARRAGVSRATISRLESGKTARIRVSTLKKLSLLYKIDEESLIGG